MVLICFLILLYPCPADPTIVVFWSDSKICRKSNLQIAHAVEIFVDNGEVMFAQRRIVNT